jgi:hypothetical protein
MTGATSRYPRCNAEVQAPRGVGGVYTPHYMFIKRGVKRRGLLKVIPSGVTVLVEMERG